jgi:hypothetical protein
MRDVTAAPDPVIDIWPYARAIRKADLQGFRPQDGVVEAVYRGGDGIFEHVLIPTRTKNVYLVVVVDRRRRAIHGHRLLNLNEKYGLPTPAAR